MFQQASIGVGRTIIVIVETNFFNARGIKKEASLSKLLVPGGGYFFTVEVILAPGGKVEFNIIAEVP